MLYLSHYLCTFSKLQRLKSHCIQEHCMSTTHFVMALFHVCRLRFQVFSQVGSQCHLLFCTKWKNFPNEHANGAGMERSDLLQFYIQGEYYLHTYLDTY